MRYSKFLGIMIMALIAVSMTAAIQIPIAAVELPTPSDVVDAGKVVGDMSALHLLGTITITSMMLAAFLAYLLYRSQRDQWQIISSMKDIIGALKEEVHNLIKERRATGDR